jgi:hypothetical protein
MTTLSESLKCQRDTTLALFQSIEGWDNCKRIHGVVGYKTPQQAEDQARQHAQ